MRFTDRYSQQSIPEWMDCYIDYKHIQNINKTIQIFVEDQDDIQYYISKKVRSRALTASALQTSQPSNSQFQKLIDTSKSLNSLFEDSLNRNLNLFQSFVRDKYEELQKKFDKGKIFLNVFKESSSYKSYRAHILTPYFEYLFIESFSLRLMVQSNIDAELRLLQKHVSFCANIYSTPEPRIQNIQNVKKFNIFYQDIEKFYMRNISQRSDKEDRFRLRRLAITKLDQPYWLLFIGIFVGLFLASGIYLGAILAYDNQKLQLNPIFNRDFPVWRGIVFIIFYIWALGVDVFFYQKYNISHRFILENRYTLYPTSSKIFGFASIFSLLFIVFFSLHALSVAQIINLGNLSAHFLPLFVWVPFLVLFLLPIPHIYYKARGYTMHLFLKIVASLVIPITFPIIWGTDQMVSLFVVFQDLSYSICYYSTGIYNASQQVAKTTCKRPAETATLIFSLVVYSYRIIQCLRVRFCNGTYWKKTQIFNSIKYALALITAVLSYMWKTDQNISIKPAWITLACLTTLFSFFWDLNFDWDLLYRHSHNFMLRDRITYSKSFYYVSIFVNFVFRCTWVLYISPYAVSTLIGSPQLFSLVFGAIQIARRGLWNLFRVEVEHVRNCVDLRAVPRQFERLEVKMDRMIKEQDKYFASSSLERIVETGKQLLQGQQKTVEQINKRKQTFKQKIKQKREGQIKQRRYLREVKKQKRNIKANLLLQEID